MGQKGSKRNGRGKGGRRKRLDKKKQGGSGKREGTRKSNEDVE